MTPSHRVLFPATVFPLAAVFATGLVGDWLHPSALLPSAALLSIALAAIRRPAWRPVLAAIALALGATLALRLWPGFDNPVIWEDARFCANCLPHSLHLSLEQAIFVAAVSPIFFGHLLPRPDAWLLPAGVATLTAAIATGTGLGLFRWEPTLQPAETVAIFAAANLLTVVFEELLFRGLLQRHLLARLGGLHAWWLTAVIFGLAHLPFGVEFAVVATIAGLGYGFVAWRSASLGPAIALHWLVNLTHFSLFSYPLLA